jgi:hypothetical protein
LTHSKEKIAIPINAGSLEKSPKLLDYFYSEELINSIQNSSMAKTVIIYIKLAYPDHLSKI